jgi:flagellar motor switch protein FliN/FliY
LGLGDALLVEPGAPAELLKLLGRGPYPTCAFTLEVEGLASGLALILFPASFAVAPDAGASAAAAPGEAGVPAPIREAGPLNTLHPNIQRILHLKLQVSVILAEKTMDLDAVIKLNPGTIIEFNKSADENLDLVVNGQRIGAGEVVIIGERFGIQLRQIEGLQQRIRKMGTVTR